VKQPKKVPEEVEPPKIKWEERYEDDDSVTIWRYDIRKTVNGPVEVEFRWKKNKDPDTKKKNERNK
jgi:hypothetical protein